MSENFGDGQIERSRNFKKMCRNRYLNYKLLMGGKDILRNEKKENYAWKSAGFGSYYKSK